MTGISKSFPGIRALADVDLDVEAGEVHAIVGENGAGKSTLVKILAGVHHPDEGMIELDGTTVRLADPIEARRRGIGMVYQELNLVPDLTVAENILLGVTPSRWGLVNRRALREQARAVLDELDARIDTDDLVGSLTVSQQQIVEIAKVYASRPKIVVLDEPTSSLSEHETQSLFRIIGRMTDAGLAVIYISHRLREVLEISQRVTVLRDGRLVETRPTQGITAPEMIRLMVGRDLTEVFPKREVEIGDVVLSANGLSRTDEFDDIHLTVRSGEIVGLAGLVGAGRTEVARAIFGLDPLDAGTIEVDGKTVTIRGPRDAVRAGIAYVPEDRKRDGIVPQLSIKDNISLSVLERVSVAGWIRPGAERALAQQKAEELSVSPPAIAPRIDTLSGG
ncbi:MAG: sugar ABC transporter ATP-binding protein, partial [Microcella sp.]|nr:sugar ABC transporter ATP-binding protein [Microcella sp.]